MLPHNQRATRSRSEISRRVYLHSLRLSIRQVSFVDGESRFMVTPSVPLLSFGHFDDRRELIGADKFISEPCVDS